MTHLFMALGIVGMAVAIFALGFQSARIWMDWRDDKQLRAAEARYERRHTHRKGDPQETVLLTLPKPGRMVLLERLPDDPDPAGEPPWLFAGESEQGWAADAAEYELLHQAVAQLPEDEDGLAVKAAVGSLDWTAARLAEVRAERLTDTGEMRALSAAWIEKMQGDSNEWIFTHLMRTSE